MNLLLTGSAPYQDFGNYANYVPFILAVLIFGLLDFVFYNWFKRWVPRVFLLSDEVAILLFYVFGFDLLVYICLAVFVIAVCLFFLQNSADGRKYISNRANKVNPKRIFGRNSAIPEAIFDRDAVYRKVADAVLIMSKKKIGALITFEKDDDLSDFIAKGVTLKCPVSSEILQTIFYPGTRLHDGAVIIRNDLIAAASVYYQTVDIAMPGKFGSRHRAALSISSQVDAVTIVVSEETGRISIAYEGELQTIEPESFLTTFEDYMALKSSKKISQSGK